MSQTKSLPWLIAVMGPTGSGKTGLAEALAERLNAQLINADAFQVYRGMDIGTAKPRRKDEYRLLDIKEPNEPFGLGEWLRLAADELSGAYKNDRSVVVVGGTGLYIRALFEEYQAISEAPDPELRARLAGIPIETLRNELVASHPEVAAATDLANPIRVRRAFERLESPSVEPVRIPPFKRLKFALQPPAEVLNERLERRTAEMVQNGWTREIEELRKRGFRRDDPGLRAIGYRAIWDHLERKISLEDAIAATIAETRRYAKRQRTWLRTEPSLVTLSATTENDVVRKAVEHIENY